MKIPYRAALLMITVRRFAFVAPFLLVIATGCSNDSGPTDPSTVVPAAIEAVSQTTIVGVVDKEVADPPRVRVVDRKGNPVSGVIVGFQTENGTVAAASSPTNTNGIASSERWKLGTQAGAQLMSANVAGLPPLLFTANAAAGPMTQISHGGDEQSARSGSALPDPLTVRLADKFNNPVSGQTVTFTVVSGGGTLERDAAVTGADGTASPGTWTLGPQRGPQHVKARFGPTPAAQNRWEVFFTAHACENPGPEGCSSVPPSCVSSTDCGEIVFVSARDGQAEIYSVNRDGSRLTRLTNNPAEDRDPAWSPDGKRIAFVSDRSSYPEIYVMNADGSNVVRRTFWANSSGHPTWSPDGKKIVFSAGSSSGMTLWSMSPDIGGAGPARLFEPAKHPPGATLQPDWSANGNRLAFTIIISDEQVSVGTANDDGSGFTMVEGSSFEFNTPSWSRSGTRLAVAFYGPAGAQLGVMNPIGSTLQPLAITALFTKSSWSPDDQLIAFAAGSPSGRNLMWVKADGSDSGLIVTNGWAPNWRR